MTRTDKTIFETTIEEITEDFKAKCTIKEDMTITQDVLYVKRTITKQKIATSTTATTTKDREIAEATEGKIGTIKTVTATEGHTIMKEISCHPEDQTTTTTVTADTTDTEKIGTMITEEDNLTMITMKMKDMKIEDTRVKDTNKEDITIIENKTGTIKETIVTMAIMEEIEDTITETGMKEIEIMEDVEWLGATKTTPNKRKKTGIEEGEEKIADEEVEEKRNKFLKKNPKNEKTKKIYENHQKHIKTNKKEEKQNHLKIGCINIRGMNDVEKQGNLRTFLGKEKWDIAIVTETKLTEQKGKYIYKGWEKYECINSSFNNDNTKSGIIILIRKSLNDRRYKVEKIDGHVIKLDILFKDKQKGIKIIGIYNPNNDKDTTGQIEKKVTAWINEAIKLNQELIILGDFNESANNKKKSKPLTQTIKRHGLEDVHECLTGKDMLDTWK
ncbi:DNase I-like protein, partial [Rhizophagus irregularis]